MTSKMLDQRYSNDQSDRGIPSFIEPMPPLISNPFMRPRPKKGTNLLELFEEDSESDEPELVQVYLRLKPYHAPNNLYEVKSDRCLITSVDTATAGHGRRTQHNVSKMYTFSHIFGPGSTQKEIFENVVKENLKKLPEGHNFTLLTYGASGSGKTYTLMGTVNSPGLVPRSLEYVFRVVDAAQQPLYKPADGLSEKLSHAEQDYELQWVKRLRHISAPLRDKYRRMSAGLCTDLTASSMDLSNRARHYVWVSFVEIYNEGIYDLLAPGDRRTASKLRIREDATGNVYVKDVTQAFVRTGEEAYDVMVAGKHNLQVAATGVHAHSSRSHCIFTITMLTETAEGGVRASCVRLCDLAGCERARATRNTGARMAESRAINSSLHVLERCLHTLRRRQRRAALSTCVPYRESKLTRLLGAGLSGARGEAVSMVVTLNPAPQYAHETKHVLQLAAVARDIQVNNTIAESTLESLAQESSAQESADSGAAMRLRTDNERLHFELLQAQSRNKELLAAMEERQQKTAATMRELVEEAKDMTRQYYEAQVEALRSEMEDMVEEYESRLQLQSKPVLPALGGSGTPSRSLQNKVAQLMTEIAILEEKLTAESLARARAEEEVQHLRACIEERDEKEENSPENQDVMLLSDSDHSDEEVDLCNESLEPTFKKEDINRSRLFAQETFDQSMTSDRTLDDSALDYKTVENDDEDQDSVINKTDDTVKDHDNTETTKEPKYATGKDNTASTNKTTDMLDSAANKTKNVSQITEFDRKSEGHFNKMSDINDEFSHVGGIQADHAQLLDKTANATQDFSYDRKLPAEREQFFDKTNSVDDREFFDKDKSESQSMYLDGYSDFEVDKINSISAPRGTYLISHNEIVEKIENDRSNIQIDVKKADSLTRGTYFVKDSHCKVIPPANACNVDDTGIEIDSPVDKFVKPAAKVSETLANKILQSLKMSNGSNTSLAQFEQLEIDSKKDEMEAKRRIGESFGCIKIPNEKKSYFDKTSAKEPLPIQIEEVEELIPTSKILKKNKSFFTETSSKKPVPKNAGVTEKLITIPKIIKEKKTFFDNINVNIEPVANKTETKKEVNSKIDDTRSPSIVKDEVTNDFKPSVITKLLGESFSKQPEISSVHMNKILSKKPDSIDIFEGLDSPLLPVKTTLKVNVVENVRLSIEKMVLHQKSASKVKQDFKTAQESIAEKSAVIHTAPTAYTPSMKINEKIENKIHTESSISKPQVTENNKLQNESVKVNNTIEEFENLCKDITSRTTDFEMLVSLNITTNKNEVRVDGPSSSFEETKYNLRHKTHNKADGVKFADKVEKAEFEEVVLESYAKCESVKAQPTKRRLRLRKRKNHPDDNSTEEAGDKLKDIVNLQKEFSDVTMDVPAPKKEVRDIQSPEKVDVEDENLPPMLGIQSCPSKSVTRSRRKLFTPRAETLDESPTGTADSHEPGTADSDAPVYVPRPSYHRTRARRKL